jgi:hypothetical protein
MNEHRPENPKPRINANERELGKEAREARILGSEAGLQVLSMIFEYLRARRI